MDINLFRDPITLEQIKQSEIARGKDLQNVIDVVEKDAKWRSLIDELQKHQARSNVIQKEISSLHRHKHLPSADDSLQNSDDDGDKLQCLIRERTDVKTMIQQVKELAEVTLNNRDMLLDSIGNLVHPTVPISNNESDNVVERIHLFEGSDLVKKYHHSEVMEKLDIVALKEGSKVAGHRGYFLKNAGVILNQALIQYSLDFLMKRGYDLLQTPFLMKNSLMQKTAQLSEFSEILYQITDDSTSYKDEKEQDDAKKCLIATSEQPISAFHADEWIDTARLPLRYAGYSTCFRKEAGSYGKDLRGIFRVHQFEKIEQFCITTPDKSWDMHLQMLKISCDFIESLGLSYRVVNIVSGELNNAAAKKYDVEAWFPNTQDYRELVSCSNCTDYQSRKLLVRCGFKKQNEKTTFVHMLNSTMCATERTLCCILENYQNDDGVVIPPVLRPYVLGGLDFLEWKK